MPLSLLWHPEYHALMHNLPTFRACSRFILIALLASQAGCAVHPPKAAPTLRAWGPDGSGDVIEKRGDPTVLDFSSGLIHHYLPGDVVELVMSIDGDIIGSTEPTTLTLQVRSPLWIYVGPDTQPLASLDGESWSPIWSAARGSVSLGFSMLVNEPRNITTLNIRAEAR